MGRTAQGFREVKSQSDLQRMEALFAQIREEANRPPARSLEPRTSSQCQQCGSTKVTCSLYFRSMRDAQVAILKVMLCERCSDGLQGELEGLLGERARTRPAEPYRTPVERRATGL